MEARVGVSVILLRKGFKHEFLIGKRKGSHGAGEWSIPGGHLEYGETFVDTCYRELEEETGIRREDIEKYPFKKFDFSEDFFGEKHYVTLYFVIDIGDNMLVAENKEPEKCDGWEWRTLNKVPKNMFCHTSDVVKKLAKELKYK